MATQHSDDNPISRIHNALAKTMMDSASIPKMIVVILEDDLINYINYDDYGVTALYGRILDTLSRDLSAAVNKFREFLPQRAKKDAWPQFVWILPSTHNNYERNENALRKKIWRRN